jgi:hypothetical protein
MALWHLSALVLWSSSRRRGSSTPWHPVATPASVPSLEDIATPSRITGGRSVSLTRSIRSWIARQACADVQSSQDPQPPLEGVSLWPRSLPWISCPTLRFDRGGAGRATRDGGGGRAQGLCGWHDAAVGCHLITGRWFNTGGGGGAPNRG